MTTTKPILFSSNSTDFYQLSRRIEQNPEPQDLLPENVVRVQFTTDTPNITLDNSEFNNVDDVEEIDYREGEIVTFNASVPNDADVKYAYILFETNTIIEPSLERDSFGFYFSHTFALEDYDYPTSTTEKVTLVLFNELGQTVPTNAQPITININVV